MYFLACKVVDQAAVIKVSRNPPLLCKLTVQLKNRVQRVKKLRGRQPAKTLGSRLRLVARCTVSVEEFAIDPGIDEQWPGGGLDHIVQLR